MKNYSKQCTLIYSAMRQYGQPVLQAKLADQLEISGSYFAPSQKNPWAVSLKLLLENSFISKQFVNTNSSKKAIMLKLLKPYEELEVFLTHYKWDKRHKNTKAKDVPCKTYKVKGDLSKAKDIVITVKDVTIKISF